MIELCHKCAGVIFSPDGKKTGLDGCRCMSMGGGVYAKTLAGAALAQIDRVKRWEELYTAQKRHVNDPAWVQAAATRERAAAVLAAELAAGRE